MNMDNNESTTSKIVNQASTITIDKQIIDGIHRKPHRSFFPYDTISEPFVGRDEILIKIEKHLLSDPVEQRTDPNRRFILWGGIGTGKKQVCLKFANANKKSFSNVWMIDASNRNSIDAKFRAIAEDLELPRGLTPIESVNTVKSWLAGQTGWLLIFDHAEDEVLQSGRYFPGGTGGMILITGRDSKLQKYAVPNDYGAKSCLESLSKDESKKLLLQLCRTMSEEEHQLEEQESEINSLADKIIYDLEYNPLAIQLVGATVQNGYSQVSLQKRMTKWRETFSEGRPRTTNSEHNYVVQKPVEAALDTIRSKAIAAKRHFAHAIELMQLLTVLDVSDISLEILRCSWINWRTCSAWWRTTYSHQYGFLMDNVSDWDDHQIQGTLEVLKKSALIRVGFSKHKAHISMNRYVRLCAYGYLREPNIQPNLVKAISTVAQSISWSDQMSEHTFRTSVVTHIDKLHKVPCGSPSEDYDGHEDWVDFWQHELILKQLGRQASLDIILKFAGVYYETGRYIEAKDMQRHAACLARSQLGTFHRTTFRAVCELAKTLQTLGEHEEALELREEAYKIRKDYEISAWRLLALWWCSFGAIVLTRSRFPLSIDDIYSTFRAVCHIHSWISHLIKPELTTPLREELKKDHLLIKLNLADSYGRLPDRKEKALEMRKEVLIKLKELENELSSPDAKALEMIQDLQIEATAKVADSHYDLRNRQEAMELRRDVLNLRKKRDDKGREVMHLTTIQALANYAESLCDIGDLEMSLKFRIDVLDQQRLWHPEAHYKVLLAKAELAISYSKTKDHGEAKRLRQEVVDNLVKLLGEDHTRTLSAQLDLGRSFAKLKDWNQALQLQIHVFQRRRDKFGYEHRDTLLSVEYIVKILKELPSRSANELATKLQMQVLGFLRASPVVDNIAILKAMSVIADCHEAASYENIEMVDDLRCKVLQKQSLLKNIGAIHIDSIRVMEQRADSIDRYYLNHLLQPWAVSSQGHSSAKSASNSQGQEDPSGSETILEEGQLPDFDETVFCDFLERDLRPLEVLNGSDNKAEAHCLFEPISLKGKSQEDKIGCLESKSVALRKFVWEKYEILRGVDDQFTQNAKQKIHNTEILYSRRHIVESKKVKVEEKN